MKVHKDQEYLVFLLLVGQECCFLLALFHIVLGHLFEILFCTLLIAHFLALFDLFNFPFRDLCHLCYINFQQILRYHHCFWFDFYCLVLSILQKFIDMCFWTALFQVLLQLYFHHSLLTKSYHRHRSKDHRYQNADFGDDSNFKGSYSSFLHFLHSSNLLQSHQFSSVHPFWLQFYLPFYCQH